MGQRPSQSVEGVKNKEQLTRDGTKELLEKKMKRKRESKREKRREL